MRTKKEEKRAKKIIIKATNTLKTN